MIKEIDIEFNNAYPRLYPLASAMKITKEEIDDLMSKIWNDWRLNIKYNQAESESIVRAILARLNHNNRTLNDLHLLKGCPDEALKMLFGIRQLEILKKILE